MKIPKILQNAGRYAGINLIFMPLKTLVISNGKFYIVAVAAKAPPPPPPTLDKRIIGNKISLNIKIKLPCMQTVYQNTGEYYSENISFT